MTLRPKAVRVYGGTVFEVWPDSVRTILPDGLELPAAPEDTAAYRATAERLGYPTGAAGLLLMCREHEETHSALAALLGLPASPALLGAARGDGPSLTAGLEEDVVLSLQRLARHLGIDLAARLARLAAR